MTIVASKAGTRGMRGARIAKLTARMLRPVMVVAPPPAGDTFQGRDVLYLTTVGAKTGKQRQTAVGYETDGEDAWLVVASLGGAAQQPGLVPQHRRAPGPCVDRGARPPSPGDGPSNSKVRGVPRRGRASPRAVPAWRSTRRRPTGSCPSCA